MFSYVPTDMLILIISQYQPANMSARFWTEHTALAGSTGSQLGVGESEAQNFMGVARPS